VSDIEEVITGNVDSLVEAFDEGIEKTEEFEQAVKGLRDAIASLSEAGEGAEAAAEEIDSIRNAAAEADQTVDDLNEAFEALVAQGPDLADIEAFLEADAEAAGSMRDRLAEAADEEAQVTAGAAGLGDAAAPLEADAAAAGHYRDNLAEAQIQAGSFKEAMAALASELIMNNPGDMFVVQMDEAGNTYVKSMREALGRSLTELAQSLEAGPSLDLVQSFLAAGQATGTWEQGLDSLDQAIARGTPLIASQAGVLDDYASAGGNLVSSVQAEVQAMQAFSAAFKAFDATGSAEDLAVLTAASDALDTALAAGSAAGEDVAQTFGGVEQATSDVAQSLANAAAEGAGMSLAGTAIAATSGEAATGIRMLDSALNSARDKAAEASAAAAFLNLDLLATDEIAKKARDALLELGYSEAQAAAGASALAAAQAAADAAMTAESGGGEGLGFAGKLLDLFGVGGEGGGGVGGLAGNLAIAAGALTAVLAISTEAGGLVAGVSAAITGVVPAVILALPSLDKLKDSYDAISTARKNWLQAEQTAKRDPTTENLAEAATDAAKLKAAYADVPAYIRPVMHDISGLSGEYRQLARDFEPDVFKTFNDGLKVAEELLPTFLPLARESAGGVDSLLGSLEKFFKAPHDYENELNNVRIPEQLRTHMQQELTPPNPTGFQKWMQQIEPDIKPAEQAIGQFIGTFVTDWGKFITTFSPKDIQNAFHVLDVTINVWTGAWTHAIKEVMEAWDLTSQIVTTGEHIYDAVSSDFSRMTTAVVDSGTKIVGDVEKWPGDIEHVFGGAASWLVSAGENVVEGLIHGMASMAGSLLSEAESLGKDAIEGAMSELGIHSPSTKFADIGRMTVEGFIVGLEGGKTAVQNAINDVLDQASPYKNTTIDAMITKMRDEVKAAAAAGVISTATESQFSKWLTEDNTRLTALAKQRKNLENEIAAADALAASVKSAEIAASTVTAAYGDTYLGQAAATPVYGSITQALQAQLAQTKQFKEDIAKLKKEGLGESQIQSLLSEGVTGGLPIADQLLAGGKSGIKQINELEAEIAAASKSLGITGANAAYESGSDIGKGLAAGLRSELKTVDSEMKKIADELVAALKRALRISSPSQATMEIGSQLGDGLIAGMEAKRAAVAAAGERMAGAATGYLPTRLYGSGGAGFGGAEPPIEIHLIQSQPIVIGGKQIARVNQKFTLQKARRNTKSGLQLQGRGV
jgi:hypothetical protein